MNKNIQKTICFFTAHYLPFLGGVERYTYNLANQLLKLGNKVIIVTSEMKGEEDFVEDGNLIIIRMKSIPLMKDRLPWIKYCSFNNQKFQYLNEAKIDFVIINTKFYPLTLLGAYWSKKHGIPSLTIEHGTGHIDFGQLFKNKIGRVYEHIMAFLMKRYCCYFVGVSNACNNWLTHFNIKAIGVLYNAIDYGQIQELSKEEQLKPKRRIVYTGRLIKEKGLLKLVEAFLLLQNKYDDIELVVAGDGPLLSDLRQEFKNNKDILFLGKLDFADVIKELNKSYVYCFPTDYPEGLPTCVLEAMACGLYVITSSLGGAKEVINDKSYGIIMKNNDVNEIYKELSYSLDNPDEIAKIAQSGKIRVCEYFTWEQTTNKLLEVMEYIKNENS